MATFDGSMVPQADLIMDVSKVVDAVSRGRASFQEIAEAIGKGERQGRYYRRAAEIIGLTRRDKKNTAALTPAGVQFAQANAQQRKMLLLQGVLANPCLAAALEFIRKAGPAGRSRHELIDWIEDNTSLSRVTAARRYMSVVRWLEALFLVQLVDHDIVRVAPRA